MTSWSQKKIKQLVKNTDSFLQGHKQMIISKDFAQACLYRWWAQEQDPRTTSWRYPCQCVLCSETEKRAWISMLLETWAAVHSYDHDCHEPSQFRLIQNDDECYCASRLTYYVCTHTWRLSSTRKMMLLYCMWDGIWFNFVMIMFGTTLTHTKKHQIFFGLREWRDVSKKSRASWRRKKFWKADNVDGRYERWANQRPIPWQRSPRVCMSSSRSLSSNGDIDRCQSPDHWSTSQQLDGCLRVITVQDCKIEDTSLLSDNTLSADWLLIHQTRRRRILIVLYDVWMIKKKKKIENCHEITNPLERRLLMYVETDMTGDLRTSKKTDRNDETAHFDDVSLRTITRADAYFLHTVNEIMWIIPVGADFTSQLRSPESA